MSAGFLLSAEFISKLRQTVKDAVDRPDRTTRHRSDYPTPPTDQASDVFVARAPAGGIPANNEGRSDTGTGTGTGSEAGGLNDDVPGSAVCQLYHLRTIEGRRVLRPIEGRRKTVFNLGVAVRGHKLVMIWKDKSGTWWVDGDMEADPETPTDSGTGTGSGDAGPSLACANVMVAVCDDEPGTANDTITYKCATICMPGLTISEPFDCSDVLCTTGTGTGTGTFIETVCCEGIPLPSTLYITIVGGPCAGGPYPLVYDEGDGEWYGTVGGGYEVSFLCNVLGESFSLRLPGTGALKGADSKQCTPFEVVFNSINVGNCAIASTAIVRSTA